MPRSDAAGILGLEARELKVKKFMKEWLEFVQILQMRNHEM